MLSMDGALIIDKPAGITSHDVVARVRNIIGERQVGHTGTLDPFATGVLVILVGRATRLAQFLSGAEKEYEAIIRLGYATDTCDLKVRVVCSAGTYVRTLAEDFGKRLGIGAHLVELRRTRAGHFKIADATTLDRLTEFAQSNSASQILISPDDALSHLPTVKL